MIEGGCERCSSTAGVEKTKIVLTTEIPSRVCSSRVVQHSALVGDPAYLCGKCRAAVRSEIVRSLLVSAKIQRDSVIRYLRECCIDAASRSPGFNGFDLASVQDFDVSLRVRGDQLIAVSARAVFGSEDSDE